MAIRAAVVSLPVRTLPSVSDTEARAREKDGGPSRGRLLRSFVLADVFTFTNRTHKDHFYGIPFALLYAHRIRYSSRWQETIERATRRVG